MPADKTWIHDPKNNPFHNRPAHNQFEVNLVSWRLSVSEVELTYDDTENLMVIDGHALPCYFADGFCKPTTKTPFALVWFSDEFCLIFTLQHFVGRTTKIDDRYWIETDSFIHSSLLNKFDTSSGIKSTPFPYIHAPQTQNQHNPITQVSHVLNSFYTPKYFVANLNLFILHNIQIFLLLIKKVSTCIQDNLILNL